MACYDVGDVARLSVVFTKLQGTSRVKADPTNVKVKIRNPANQITEDTFGAPGSLIVRDRTGEYHIDVPTSVVGEWWHRWIGTGAVATADEEKFTVRQSVFADPT